MAEQSLRELLRSYFGNGGLWNPEHMEHDKVRELLAELDSALGRLEELEQRLRDQHIECIRRANDSQGTTEARWRGKANGYEAAANALAAIIGGKK